MIRLNSVCVYFCLSLLLTKNKIEATFVQNGQRITVRSNKVSLNNIFDDLKLIFSEEGKANRAAYEERERAAMEAKQQEILARRRNPELMEEYEREVAEKRANLAKEKQVWEFQNKVGEEGYDPMNEWKKLRQEGKIKVGSDLERDPSSSRLGSEGLVDVRVDERMPYIDQGYVDPEADVIGNFMKMFGGGKGKKE